MLSDPRLKESAQSALGPTKTVDAVFLAWRGPRAGTEFCALAAGLLVPSISPLWLSLLVGGLTAAAVVVLIFTARTYYLVTVNDHEIALVRSKRMRPWRPLRVDSVFQREGVGAASVSTEGSKVYIAGRQYWSDGRSLDEAQLIANR